MTKEEKFNYWLECAEYDLGTAEAMNKTGRYLYVLFMCQQSLEKLLKGLYCLIIDDNIPRVHNLSFLMDKLLEATA